MVRGKDLKAVMSSTASLGSAHWRERFPLGQILLFLSEEELNIGDCSSGIIPFFFSS